MNVTVIATLSISRRLPFSSAMSGVDVARRTYIFAGLNIQ
jgi:hypothetical protein